MGSQALMSMVDRVELIWCGVLQVIAVALIVLAPGRRFER
jgi:hypothetical protein